MECEHLTELNLMHECKTNTKTSGNALIKLEKFVPQRSIEFAVINIYDPQ